jgi:hypothetical protein
MQDDFSLDSTSVMIREKGNKEVVVENDEGFNRLRILLQRLIGPSELSVVDSNLPATRADTECILWQIQLLERHTKGYRIRQYILREKHRKLLTFSAH